MNILNITTSKNDNKIYVSVKMPSGKSKKEINELVEKEFTEKATLFHGKEVYIEGRLTTHLAMYLGHALAHICQKIYLYDPMESEYILVIYH